MKAIWQNCTFFIGPFEGVGTLYGQHLLEHQFKAALVLCLDRMEEEVVVLHISSRALEKISIGQRHFHPQQVTSVAPPQARTGRTPPGGRAV